MRINPFRVILIPLLQQMAELYPEGFHRFLCGLLSSSPVVGTPFCNRKSVCICCTWSQLVSHSLHTLLRHSQGVAGSPKWSQHRPRSWWSRSRGGRGSLLKSPKMPKNILSSTLLLDNSCLS